MNAIGKIVTHISSMLEFNNATLSGALDVIVVEQEDGRMVCNPFRVRFGKLKILKSQSQSITITVNRVLTPIHMKLSTSGEGYFPKSDEPSPLLGDQMMNSENSPNIDNYSPDLRQDLDRDNLTDEGFPSSPTRHPLEVFRSRPEPIKPKRGDFCDDLLAGDEEQAPEEEKHTEEPENEEISVEMSMCAELWDQEPDKEHLFSSNLVKFEDFSQNPWAIINNPNLLIKLGNKVYTKDAALPMILSLIIFKQSLTNTKDPSDFPKQRPQNIHCSPEVRNRSSNLALTSDQLKSLGLKPGKNEVVYTVFSDLQGKQEVFGNIYLWKHNCKIVISDIDGTITKSDVLGHLFSMVGKDWSHPGIAHFYHNISENGYNFLYLSSRAIGQANFTREYLLSLKQDDYALPDGPLIISPDRLFKSFFREVIEKNPQKFKTAALNEIGGLFPLEHCPFYAGFGNRDTDAIAYRAAGVDLNRIFIINPAGNIFVFNENVYSESYPQLSLMVNEIFPPVSQALE